MRNYYRDKVKDDASENNVANDINDNRKITSNYFEHKTKIIERPPDNNNTLDTRVVRQLKCLSNF